MARDQALLQNARVDLQRYRGLAPQGSIPRRQLDTQEALVRQYEGVVQADQGQIDNARLQLEYCRITAPISGRLGLRLVDAGNIVHAADATGLVVITQVEPIAVVFSLPEDSVPPVLEKLAAGAHLAVDAYDRDGQRRLATGSLLTVDNQVDPATGTVRLKATFPNADHRLFPSQFVNARLQLDVRRGATVVPAAAVQRGSQGTFVYVVQPDQTAAVRAVKVGVTEGDDAAIESGVVPGDLVVVDGTDRLRDGTRVVMQTPAATGTRRP
jgi:multidrug efflux system membrane fusion protein